jgi:hypothetical protein
MTNEDIINMARHADREWDCDRNMQEWVLEFGESVAAAEREACAKLCKQLWEDDATAYECAAAIRARGTK